MTPKQLNTLSSFLKGYQNLCNDHNIAFTSEPDTVHLSPEFFEEDEAMTVTYHPEGNTIECEKDVDK